MDIYKALAIKTLIRDFALLQFAQNGITNEEAALIMDSVSNDFQKSAFDTVIKGLINNSQKSDESDDTQLEEL